MGVHGCIYIKVKFIITLFALHSKQKRRKNGDLRLHAVKPASGLLKLDAGLKLRPKRKTQDCVKEETKRHG